ncbi:mannosyltransferase [Rhodococcus rhodnii]|uniref:Mannosyltransferase n=2 Tax=Rhodococcus rhodnii TaxID=38312 RepID=R7WLF8_9NOCA|nr:mannosyltransferase [Rhodococcus rhodnii]EOM76142.1 mannosyltransferase [Rhodococcus rhodnii LMG 5362]TXG91792.1 mannosyltransferase [Rhodococcus rhodnii]
MSEQGVVRSGSDAARPVLRWAPWLLAVAVLARLAWTLFSPNGMNLVDLHVYVGGAASLWDGDLYDFTYSEDTPDFPLPFTYPPFAALVFYPLHVLPFALVGIAWQLATVAGLYVLVRMSQRLLLGDGADGPRAASIAMVWTAVGMWTEPVRTTLDYGQVNVFLALALVGAALSTRWWLSGALVGIAAGIKLTPAITGLYLLTQRRWRAAVFSAVAFAGTVALSWLLVGSAAREYFTTLLGDADRIGPVASVWNQSLRGALSRVAGEDVGSGPLWLGACAVVGILAIAAWRGIGSADRLGTLLVVQLFGLCVSPISWSHHWVWAIPLLVWLVHGPYAHLVATRIVAGYWLVTTLVGVPWVLSFFQDSIWDVSRPGVLAWIGAVDVVGVVAVYVLFAVAGRARRDVTPDPAPARSNEPVRRRAP